MNTQTIISRSSSRHLEHVVIGFTSKYCVKKREILTLPPSLFGALVSDHPDSSELPPLSPRLDPLGRPLPPPRDPFSGERPKMTGPDYRALWKTAIHQQILLLRMEKENQRLEGELRGVNAVPPPPPLWSHEGRVSPIHEEHLRNLQCKHWWYLRNVTRLFMLKLHTGPYCCVYYSG